jgi:hypothetical protein
MPKVFVRLRLGKFYLLDIDCGTMIEFHSLPPFR